MAHVTYAGKGTRSDPIDLNRELTVKFNPEDDSAPKYESEYEEEEEVEEYDSDDGAEIRKSRAPVRPPVRPSTPLSVAPPAFPRAPAALPPPDFVSLNREMGRMEGLAQCLSAANVAFRLRAEKAEKENADLKLELGKLKEVAYPGREDSCPTPVVSPLSSGIKGVLSLPPANEEGDKLKGTRGNKAVASPSLVEEEVAPSSPEEGKEKEGLKRPYSPDEPLRGHAMVAIHRAVFKRTKFIPIRGPHGGRRVKRGASV